jgi:hypothetical protein
MFSLFSSLVVALIRFSREGQQKQKGIITARTHVAVTVTGAASALPSQVTRKTEALSTSITTGGVTGFGVLASIPHSLENGALGAGKTAFAAKVGKARPPPLVTVRLRIRATRLSAIGRLCAERLTSVVSGKLVLLLYPLRLSLTLSLGLSF